MTACADCGSPLHPKAVRQGAEHCWHHLPPRALAVQAVAVEEAPPGQPSP